MPESVNPQKLHQELKTAGLPVVGVSSSGRVDYSRSLTSTEKEAATQVITAHDPSVSDRDVFIERLAREGISRDDVLYILWKSVVEVDGLNNDKLMESIKKLIFKK